MSQLAHPTPPPRIRRLGRISTTMGVLAVLGSAWSFYLTLGSAGPELSNLLRGIGMALLPIGLLIGIPAGLMAVRQGGTEWTGGYVGLVLAVVALAAFVGLLASVDY